MKPLLSILCLGWILVLARPADAHILDVHVYPEQPQEGETLYVDVQGYLPDSCWDLTGISREVVDQEIRVFIDLEDSWEPGTSCLTVITDYWVSFDFAGLDAGSWTLVVTERRDSPRLPEDQVIVLPIEITGLVAAPAASWSAVRSRYR